MCIALLSSAHPDYALVLISNRDEYLHRPTQSASWWSAPNEHVLGGRDLLRREQGTWLGVTRGGRVAVLTNFRDEGPIAQEARSRGAIVNAFLTQPADSAIETEDSVKSLIGEKAEGVAGVGGFSLVCGQVGSPLAVVSNRTPNVEGITWVLKQRGETIGLSNATLDDRSWPKVNKGEERMRAVIATSVMQKDTKMHFVEEMMRLLSTNDMPRRDPRQGWESYSKQLRHTIFVPRIRGEGMDDDDDEDEDDQHHDKHNLSNHHHHHHHHQDQAQPSNKSPPPQPSDALGGIYGTQTQTVVLVDHDGLITFVERRLYDSSARPIIQAKDRDRVFEFQIETRR